MTTPEQAAAAERARIVGALLAHVGRLRLAGRRREADALDVAALEIEHARDTERTGGAA
jgi:hypothetical protein